jgi:hypothetical protein
MAGKRTAWCCSAKLCRALVMDLDALFHVKLIVENARWAGAPSQAEMARRYFRQQMSEAVGELASSEDALARVLVEIVEEMEEVETG